MHLPHATERRPVSGKEKHMSQSPDLPLPHGLAPSETMVSIPHPPLSTEKPRNKGFSGSHRPRDQGVGVDPCLLNINMNKFGEWSQDWVGGKILCMCVLGSSLMGEKKHIKTKSPGNPGTIPWKCSLCVCVCVCVCFFSWVFFVAPNSLILHSFVFCFSLVCS